MNALLQRYGPLFWMLTAALFAVMVVRVFFFTPVEATMGPVQKVFYLHLPAAISTFLACTVVFIASIGYLWQRRQFWDDLALAAAKVAVLLCSIVLISGMVWAREAWGTWWTWSPRLTFSLLLWLLYAVYLIIRPAIEPKQRRALVAAVYGIIAFIDVPLVYLSVRLMVDVHPVDVQLAPAMRTTLWISFVPVVLACVGLIAMGTLALRRSAPASVPQASAAGPASWPQVSLSMKSGGVT